MGSAHFRPLRLGFGMKAESRFHEEFRRDEDHAGGSDRGFGFVFAVACAVFGAINYWNDHHWWPWLLAAAAVFLCWRSSRRACSTRSIGSGQIRAALTPCRAAGRDGPVVLHDIVPMGLLSRLAGKDFLRQRLDPAADSYWIARDPPGPSPDSFKNQF